MGRLRIGVSARILIGISLLAALTVATSIIAYTALVEFRENFSATAEHRIPRMLVAAQLREESNGVLADMAALVLAENRYQRRLVSASIEGRLQTMEVLVATLREMVVDARWVDGLEQIRNRLSRDVLALDTLLQSGFQARTQLRLRLERLRRLEQQTNDVAADLLPLLDQERPAAMSGWGEYAFMDSLNAAPGSDKAYLRGYARPLQAWLDRLHEARMLVAESMALGTQARISARQNRFESAVGELQRGIETLPQELGERLVPLLNGLKAVALGVNGLFNLRVTEIARSATLDRLLSSSRSEADRLAEEVADLIAASSSDIRRDAARFGGDIDGLTAFISTASLMSLLGAAGLAVYVNSGVRRRLRRLQQALGAYSSHGTLPPEDRSADEIGDIGRALGYFIREIRSRERRLQELALTDPLTEVSNRRHFFEQAARELAVARRGNRRLAVLMLDIDRFKTINDRYGHAAGDAALRELAHACRKSLRQQDILGRLGGEEFAILLPDTGIHQAQETAERLRRTLAVPMTVDDRTLRLTVSIGVTVCDAGDTDIDTLLSRADRALYEAKEGQRDCVRVHPPPDPDHVPPGRALSS